MLASKRTIDMSSMSNRTELLASTEKSRDTRDVNEKVTSVIIQKIMLRYDLTSSIVKMQS
jgi:hypothetical protein